MGHDHLLKDDRECVDLYLGAATTTDSPSSSISTSRSTASTAVSISTSPAARSSRVPRAGLADFMGGEGRCQSVLRRSIGRSLGIRCRRRSGSRAGVAGGSSSHRCATPLDRCLQRARPASRGRAQDRRARHSWPPQKGSIDRQTRPEPAEPTDMASRHTGQSDPNISRSGPNHSRTFETNGRRSAGVHDDQSASVTIPEASP